METIYSGGASWKIVQKPRLCGSQHITTLEELKLSVGDAKTWAEAQGWMPTPQVAQSLQAFAAAFDGDEKAVTYAPVWPQNVKVVSAVCKMTSQNKPYLRCTVEGQSQAIPAWTETCERYMNIRAFGINQGVALPPSCSYAIVDEHADKQGVKKLVVTGFTDHP